MRLSLDKGWRFALGHAADPSRDFGYASSRELAKAGWAEGAAAADFDDSAWRPVDVPHDWAIELPLDPSGSRDCVKHGYHALGPEHPEHSIGWYRRAFLIPAEDLGRRISVEFDGVFRDSITWLNGHYLGRHMSGYIGHAYDLSDCLNYGGNNVLVCRVDATRAEGWFYEGAGIYRHVWMENTAPLHVARWGACVRAEWDGARAARLEIRTRVENDQDAASAFSLESVIEDPDGRPAAAAQAVGEALPPWECREMVQAVELAAVQPWSLETPRLYRLRTLIRDRGGAVTDQRETLFGIRSVRWDPDRGLLLNGRPVRIRGACCHQDHAAVGTALPDRLQEHRVRLLKEMGCNAYRTAHHPPAPELLDACDRLGMLVMDETRLPGSAPEVLGQMERLVLRDRNHPSVVLWSIGNEELIQDTPVGERIARCMKRAVKRLDPTRAVTAAMNNGGVDAGFARVVDVHGWNYFKIGDLDAWREAHPRRPVVGSEEASAFGTRGAYADVPARGHVAAYDVGRFHGYCAGAEEWVRAYARRPFLAGGFIWTGFDYRGESGPFHWPAVSANFGAMDLCGFPKDSYYYYKAWWTAAPVLHLFPHWNWQGSEGRAIRVVCYSNCRSIELSLNGRSLGVRAMPPLGHLEWEIPYAPGRLEARGLGGDGQVVATVCRETSGPPARLCLECPRRMLDADGADVACVAVSALDSQGRPVPDAGCGVQFDLAGPGRILGTGNGDPASHEPDKAPCRRLFNGLCLVILQAEAIPGALVLTARGEGLMPADMTFTTRAPPPGAIV